MTEGSKSWSPPDLSSDNLSQNWIQLSTRAFKILNYLVDFSSKESLSKALSCAAYSRQLIANAKKSLQEKNSTNLAAKSQSPSPTPTPNPFSLTKHQTDKWFTGLERLVALVQACSDSRITDEIIMKLEGEYKKQIKISTLEAQIVRPSATRFHLGRRTEMLRKYGNEIRAIHRIDDSYVTFLTVFGLVVLQVWIAVELKNYSYWLNNLLSATVGSFCAYGYQTMNHILMHSNMRGRKGLALLASSCR